MHWENHLFDSMFGVENQEIKEDIFNWLRDYVNLRYDHIFVKEKNIDD